MARALGTAVGWATGVPLAALSAMRRGKAVHPHGVVHAATLVVGDDVQLDADLFRSAGRRPAIVRFSRALGLPRPLPDLLGMSIRFIDAYGPDRHQDLLLVTSADAPIIHHGFLPARDVQSRPYTSSLPYRVGDRLLLVGALPDPGSPRPEGRDEMARLALAAATGRMRFRLAVAPPFGRFRPVAELWIGERLANALDALRFSPANAGGGLRPAGFLNRARERAYPMSQAAWRLARGDGAERQDAAERALDGCRAAQSRREVA